MTSIKTTLCLFGFFIIFLKPGEYYAKFWRILGQEYTANIAFKLAHYRVLRVLDARIFDIEDQMNDLFLRISCEYVQLTIFQIIHYMSLYKFVLLKFLLKL